MTKQPVHILLVEDDDVDAEMIARSFAQLDITYPIIHVQDGIEALDTLRGRNNRERIARPYLILLDINLPRMNGLEFLKIIREDDELRNSIVFILTTSANDQDMITAYGLHSAGYFLKSSLAAGESGVAELMKHYGQIVEFPSGK